jgi:hypothetical protein
MDRVLLVNLMMTVLAATSIGCASPAPFFEKTAESRSGSSEQQSASISDVDTKDTGQAATTSQVRVSDAAHPPAANPANNDELRAALESLRQQDPQKHARFTAILGELDPATAQPYEQYLRDQYIAMLIHNARQNDVPATADAAAPQAHPASLGTVQLTSGTSAPLSDSPVPGPLATSQPPAPVATGSQATDSSVATAAVATTEPAPTTTETTGAPATEAETTVAYASKVDGGTPTTTEQAQEETEQATEDLERGMWLQQLLATRDVVEKELARFEHDEADDTRLRAYLRLLNVIANRREQAVEPIDGLSADEQEFWKHLSYSLLISLDADGMHASSRRAALALRDLRLATDHLASISTLDVRGLAFCNRVESYGRFTEFKSYTFAPGDEVLLYVEVDNFAVEQQGDEFETELQGEYDILDEQGIRVTNVVLPRDKQLCRNRRRDYFIAYRLYLPDDIRPGEYSLRLTIEDVKGKKSNQAAIDFRIR